MKLIFASNNQNKLAEIQKLIAPNIEVITLKEAGIFDELPEPFETFRENAWSKANYVFKKTALPCFAEDSGIIANGLGNEPGVFSARYAGEPTNDARNNAKLLNRLSDKADRSAYYQATICFLDGATTSYFEGRCTGVILEAPRGDGGFGYDPLFLPDGYTKTFGELPLSTKNTISHRGKAVSEFIAFLNSGSRV